MIPRGAFGPLLSPGREQRTLDLSRPWNAGPLCGPNALYLLARLEGRELALDDLYALIPVDREAGCTLEDLVNAAAAAGFPANARLVSDRELPQIAPPYVLHLAAAEEQPQKGHFVVVFEYRDSDRKFGIIDPGTGEYSYTSARGLLRSYSGYILMPRRGVPRVFVVANCVLLGGAFVFCAREALRGAVDRSKSPKGSMED